MARSHSPEPPTRHDCSVIGYLYIFGWSAACVLPVFILFFLTASFETPNYVCKDTTWKLIEFHGARLCDQNGTIAIASYNPPPIYREAITTAAFWLTVSVYIDYAWAFLIGKKSLYNETARGAAKMV